MSSQIHSQVPLLCLERKQAEDGIRDRSPSRGLGDVYKRQVTTMPMVPPVVQAVAAEAVHQAVHHLLMAAHHLLAAAVHQVATE